MTGVGARQSLAACAQQRDSYSISTRTGRPEPTRLLSCEAAVGEFPCYRTLAAQRR